MDVVEMMVEDFPTYFPSCNFLFLSFFSLFSSFFLFFLTFQKNNIRIWRTF